MTGIERAASAQRNEGYKKVMRTKLTKKDGSDSPINIIARFMDFKKKAWLIRVQALRQTNSAGIYYCFPPSINISFTLISVM